MDDYWTDFVRESEEQITELNNALLRLERSPDDEAAMEEIFRIAHTLKGNCGAMGLNRASTLAHVIEDLLDAVRSGKIEISSALMDTIFDGVDELEAMLDEVERSGEVRTDPASTIDALREQLDRTGGPPRISEPSDDEIDRVLARFDPPIDEDHDAYLVRLSVNETEGVNNGALVVGALIDAFDLVGTDPPRETVDEGEYGETFDAVFGSAVGEAAIAAALEPVDAVADFEIVRVTGRFESADEDDADADENVSADRANEMSVDELLDEFTEFDDLDAMVEEVDDVSAFDEMGEAGAFRDLLDEEPELEPDVEDATTVEDDADEADDELDGDSADEDDVDDVDDAGAVFAELKQEVEMVGFDELQDELDELEFDEFDDDDEVEMDELLGEDVDVSDNTFLDAEVSDGDIDDMLVDAGDAAADSKASGGPEDDHEDAIGASDGDAEFEPATAESVEDGEPGESIETIEPTPPDQTTDSTEPADAESEVAESAAAADAAPDESDEADADDVSVEGDGDDIVPSDDDFEAFAFDGSDLEPDEPEPTPDETESVEDQEIVDDVAALDDVDFGDEADEADEADDEPEVEGADDTLDERTTGHVSVEEPGLEAGEAAVDADATDVEADAVATDESTVEADESAIETDAAETSDDGEAAVGTDAADVFASLGDAGESTSEPIEDDTESATGAADVESEPIESETLEDDGEPIEAEAELDAAESGSEPEPLAEGDVEPDTSIETDPDAAEAEDELETPIETDSDDPEGAVDDAAASTEAEIGAESTDEAVESVDEDDEFGDSDADIEASVDADVEASVDTDANDDGLVDANDDESADAADEADAAEYDGLAAEDEIADAAEDEPIDEYELTDEAEYAPGFDAADDDFEEDIDDSAFAEFEYDDSGGEFASPETTFDPAGATGGSFGIDDQEAERDGDDRAESAEPEPADASAAADAGASDGTADATADAPEITVPDRSARPESDVGTDQIQSVRVDVDQVDSLLNLVEGLVTSRVRLRHAIEMGEDLKTIDDELDDLEDLTTELQETVMDVRLVPLQTIANRLPRVVRDIARDQEKEVVFELSGEDVEIDRSVLDRIGDPLIHLVRNAVDHGIESPGEREATGKPREGTVELGAERSRDRVTIEISDDGSGLDPDRLRSAAVDAGILTESDAEDLSDDEAYDLVFHPGLTTADEVTDVSGRGVGMDVVKRTIDDLDGSVSVDSEPGEGTTVTMSLPVTVAIADVLFVESGGEEFGVPIKVVHDIDGAGIVETAEGRSVIRDGDEEFPVVDLARTLGTPDAGANGDGMVVRIRDDVRQVALRCDEVQGQQEVVVKPFEGFMGDIPGLSGATVRGRGEVVNILDVKTL